LLFLEVVDSISVLAHFVTPNDAVPSHPRSSDYDGHWRRRRGGEIHKRERRIRRLIQHVQRDSSNGAVAWSYSLQHCHHPLRALLPSSPKITLVRFLSLSKSPFFIFWFTLIEFWCFVCQGFWFSVCVFGASYRREEQIWPKIVEVVFRPRYLFVFHKERFESLYLYISGTYANTLAIIFPSRFT